MREIEARDTAMPCPYRGSICIESLEKWYNVAIEPLRPEMNNVSRRHHEPSPQVPVS
jgi:hypothetical protein